MNTTPSDNPYGAPSSEPHFAVNGQVSELAIDLLRRTKGWVFFLVILGYIGTAFMLLAAFGMMVGGAYISSAAESELPMSISALGFVYLALAALYVYPCVKLHQYSNSIKKLISSKAAIDLETALDKQRGFWKFCGIFAAIMCVAYAGVILVAIVGGIAASQV